MKKILLLLCLFLGMQTYAQDEVRELTTVIKVTPSSSERFDVAQLQLELNGQGMPENGLFGMQLPVVSRASCLITLTRITSSGFTCRTSRFLTKGRYFLISATRKLRRWK